MPARRTDCARSRNAAAAAVHMGNPTCAGTWRTSTPCEPGISPPMACPPTLCRPSANQLHGATNTRTPRPELDIKKYLPADDSVGERVGDEHRVEPAGKSTDTGQSRRDPQPVRWRSAPPGCPAGARTYGPLGPPEAAEIDGPRPASGSCAPDAASRPHGRIHSELLTCPKDHLPVLVTGFSVPQWPPRCAVTQLVWVPPFALARKPLFRVIHAAIKPAAIQHPWLGREHEIPYVGRDVKA